MEKMGCDGQPRSLGCCFWWPLLAANEGGEEKMKEREDGSGYIKEGKTNIILPLEFFLNATCVSTKSCVLHKRPRPIPRNPRLGNNRRSEKLASRENESCVYRKDKKAWVI